MEIPGSKKQLTPSEASAAGLVLDGHLHKSRSCCPGCQGVLFCLSNQMGTWTCKACYAEWDVTTHPWRQNLVAAVRVARILAAKK